MGVVATEAVSIIDSVGRGDSFAGLMATAFFLAGSLTALSAGPHLDRLGVRRVALTAGSVSAVLALPLLALGGPWELLAGSALAGAAFAVTLPATNAILRSALAPRHLVVGVCVKQAAVPLSLLLAGGAVSLLGAGPRATFLAADAMAVAVLAVFVWATRRARPVVAAGSSRLVDGHAQVLRYGVATLLASLTAGALIGYSSITLQATGMSATRVAHVLVVGNLAGISTRVLSGLVAQRLQMTSWWPVALMMIAGAAGTLGLCSGEPVVAGVGVLIAFALGWGWSGLTFALVLASSPHRPASSGAMLQAGGMVGTAIGPLVMVAADHSVGLAGGWVLMAAALAAAGWTVAPVRRRSALHHE
jgi:MFS family permease